MNPTDELTQQTYLSAQRELEEIVRSRQATREQKQAALDALDELDRRFLRRTADSLAARTEDLRMFATELSRITRAIESHGGPMQAINRLQRIVDEANRITSGEDASG